MQKYYFLFNDGSKINQIICAVIINLPVFAYGMCTGWISPMTLLLQSKKSPRAVPLTDIEVSWMAAISHLVGIPAYYVMAYMGDIIGRKSTLIFTSFSCVILWILKLSSLETWALLSSRALVGISMAGSYVICPVYTKEISEDCVRGILATLIILFHSTGNLFAFIIGDLLDYYTILWICVTIPVLHLALFVFMPESPSFSIKNGKIEDAVKAIAWLRCRSKDDGVVLSELERIKLELQTDLGTTNFLPKAIIRNKTVCKAFRMAMVICVGREFCGIVAVLNFAGDIFTKASKDLLLSPNQQAMVIGAVPVVGALVASMLVERAGRKTLLLLSSIITCLLMTILASWFLCYHLNIFMPEWILVIIMCLYILSDAAGLLPIPVVVIGEIFSFKYRATVYAATMASASLVDFFLLLFFKPAASALGVYTVFYFFGIMCLFNGLYVLFSIPETKMKSLEEIYQEIG